MNELAHDSWPEANQRYLTGRLSSVRLALERHATRSQSSSGAGPDTENAESLAPEPTEPVAKAAPVEQSPNANFAPWALDLLSEMFHLSRFEQDLLLLCAGMEFDASFPLLSASSRGHASRNYATFSLALAALSDPHWNALTPTAPLRRWRLI